MIHNPQHKLKVKQITTSVKMEEDGHFFKYGHSEH